jgi:hypothetical protein
MRLEVFTAVKMIIMMTIIWLLAQMRFSGKSQRFGEKCLHLNPENGKKRTACRA